MKNWIKTLSIFIIISPIISAVGKGMDKKDFVPQWAKEVVWYQIFPERFRNGDKTNDPDVNSLKGSPIGISSRIMKRKMERIFGLISSAEDMAVTCRELSTNLTISKISEFLQSI
jgi:hypothetical protein